MKRLDEIFDIKYGSQLDLNKCVICEKPEGYNFVNRSSKNCGVSARILEEGNKKPFPAGLITVAMGGSVLSSFVQQEPFYTGQNVKVLKPKQEMSDLLKLYYCYCIEQNIYRFSTFGREANVSFGSIIVPDIEDMPQELNNIEISDYEFDKKPIIDKKIELNTEKWEWFNLYDTYFEMFAGKYYPKDSFSVGKTPLISTSKIENGVMAFTDLRPTFKGNCITIGKVEMTTFYQPLPFCATADVTVLAPKFEMSKYCALFLQIILGAEKYRWTYGNQIRLNDCQKIKIKLPITSDGLPDWQFMEDYIKSLPYSGNI
ncbi:MAG: restriction endonuclease subunit S [Dysgonamonadaceae bacterium]|jgi:hypothetical protein|nr:restriction endonuclease subunit S [Dysgonamonadaceae bacterium]